MLYQNMSYIFPNDRSNFPNRQIIATVNIFNKRIHFPKKDLGNRNSKKPANGVFKGK